MKDEWNNLKTLYRNADKITDSGKYYQLSFKTLDAWLMEN